jgi:GNAT superfamily N-acetyltransferase
VAERLKAAVLKTANPQGFVGSNPTPSAICRRLLAEVRNGIDPGGLDDGDAPKRVWAPACFFIRRQLRSQGISKTLLRAAIDHAARRGTTVVEACPADPESPS